MTTDNNPRAALVQDAKRLVRQLRFICTDSQSTLESRSEAVRECDDAIDRLAAAPEQAARVPLSDEQIDQAMLDADWPPSIINEFIKAKLARFARYIELAHGVTP